MAEQYKGHSIIIAISEQIGDAWYALAVVMPGPRHTPETFSGTGASREASASDALAKAGKAIDGWAAAAP